MTADVDPASGKRHHPGPKQIHHEQPPQRRRPKVRSRTEMKRDVQEYRDLHEQHAEANGVGAYQLRISESRAMDCP